MFHQIRKASGLDQRLHGRILYLVTAGTHQIAANDAQATLAWLVSAGIDTLVDEQPRNWLAEPARVPQPPPIIARADPRTPARASAPAAMPPGPATDLAAAAESLAALDAAVQAFDHPLRPAPDAVPALLTGNISSGVLVLADWPDVPGSAEAVLRGRMLAAIGLDASSHAAAHLLPWPTPGGRAARPEEIQNFAPFLARALALAAPRCILALGDKAAALADASRGLPKLRGEWLMLGGVPFIASFHPRQLLRQPDLKRFAWADLQAFAARLSS